MTPGENTDFKVDPHPMADPHSSWTKFYRLVKPFDRPIGTAADERGHLDGLEYLATTAKEHYDRAPGYRPQGLVSYLANPANVHVELVPATAEPAIARGPRPADAAPPAPEEANAPARGLSENSRQ